MKTAYNLRTSLSVSVVNAFRCWGKKHCPITCRGILLAFVLGLAAELRLVAQDTITRQLVVPDISNSQPGSGSTDVPFLGNNTYIQTAYDHSLFNDLTRGGFITGISFRAEEGLSQPFDATYSHMTLYLATFPQPIENLPSIF